jgi:hypothetical protein
MSRTQITNRSLESGAALANLNSESIISFTKSLSSPSISASISIISPNLVYNTNNQNIEGVKTFVNGISSVNLSASGDVVYNTTSFTYASGGAIAHRTALKVVNITPYNYTILASNNQTDPDTIYIVTE